MVALRRNQDGSPMVMVTLVCPFCGHAIAGNLVETMPPQPGLVPYCPLCLQDNRWTVLERKQYASGPPTLILG